MQQQVQQSARNEVAQGLRVTLRGDPRTLLLESLAPSVGAEHHQTPLEITKGLFGAYKGALRGPGAALGAAACAGRGGPGAQAGTSAGSPLREGGGLRVATFPRRESSYFTKGSSP